MLKRVLLMGMVLALSAFSKQSKEEYARQAVTALDKGGWSFEAYKSLLCPEQAQLFSSAPSTFSQLAQEGGIKEITEVKVQQPAVSNDPDVHVTMVFNRLLLREGEKKEYLLAAKMGMQLGKNDKGYCIMGDFLQTYPAYNYPAKKQN